MSLRGMFSLCIHIAVSHDLSWSDTGCQCRFSCWAVVWVCCQASAGVSCLGPSMPAFGLRCVTLEPIEPLVPRVEGSWCRGHYELIEALCENHKTLASPVVKLLRISLEAPFPPPDLHTTFIQNYRSSRNKRQRTIAIYTHPPSLAGILHKQKPSKTLHPQEAPTVEANTYTQEPMSINI